MDTKSDDQFLAIEATIEANKQEIDKNHNETTENIKQLTETLNKVLKGTGHWTWYPSCYLLLAF